MNLKSLAPGIGAALFAIAGIVLSGTAPAKAATAIMLDRDKVAVGYCAGQSDPYAAMTCAQRRCESRGGRNCQVIEGCPRRGHGAIAIDKAARSVGSACGKASPAEARAQAMQQCAARGSNCKIVEVFSDAPKTAKSAPSKPKTPQRAAAPAPKAQAQTKPKQPAAKPATTAAKSKPAAPQAQAPAVKKAEPVPSVKPPKAKPPSAADVAATAAPAAGKPAESKAPAPKKPAAQTAKAPEPPPDQPAAGGAVPDTAKPGAAQSTAMTAPDAATARKKRMQELLEALRRRADAKTGSGPLTPAQKQMADQLVGVWSSQNCAQKFWRITKANEKRYDVFVWYEDGHEDKTHFTISFDNDLMILKWANRLPNAVEGLKRGRRYVEAVARVEENAYTVVQNNYRDFDRPWTVRRCTAKR